MFDEIQRKIREGLYPEALQMAKRTSIDLLKQNKIDQAALALSTASHVLCLLNFPTKAKSFAQEAHDLATRSGDPVAVGAALAVGALARLRMAELDGADAHIDRALETLSKYPDHEMAAFAGLVSAEISIAQEDYAEARVYAEDAFASGAYLGASWIRARACLVKAICEERTGNLMAAIELLRTAERELERQSDAETRWLVEAALASALLKSRQEKEGAARRKSATEAILKLAGPLDPEARERFLRNPAIVNAMGGVDLTASGRWKAPMQIAPSGPPAIDAAALQKLRPILEVIKKINTELNLRKLITMILDTMIEFCNAERGTLVLFDGQKFKVEISRDRTRQELQRFDMGVSRTVLALVRDHGRRVVSGDAQKDPQLKLIESIHEQSLLSILCLPLRAKTRLLGAVYLDNPFVAGAFKETQIELAEILTDHAAISVDNALLHIKSIHDGLTNVFNHGHFEKRLEQEIARARRHNRPCGLLMLDLDDFKVINDTHGHEAGNEVLKGVARIVAATVRGGDLVARIQEREVTPVVARYGGDEFEVILPETGQEGILRAANRLLAAFREEDFRYGTRKLRPGISIGAAVFPDDAADARELILRADEALYTAKRAGKNRAVLYRTRDAATHSEPR